MAPRVWAWEMQPFRLLRSASMPTCIPAHLRPAAWRGSGGTICIEITETGRLHSGVADFGDLGHCSGEVGFGVVANRPELEGNRGVGHRGGLVIG